MSKDNHTIKFKILIIKVDFLVIRPSNSVINRNKFKY